MMRAVGFSEIDASCWLLRYAMDGVGTSEDIIARVIGGAEKEFAMKIKERYDEKYSRSLVTDLESEVGGNLVSAVLKWLAPPKTGYFAGNAELTLDESTLSGCASPHLSGPLLPCLPKLSICDLFPVRGLSGSRLQWSRALTRL